MSLQEMRHLVGWMYRGSGFVLPVEIQDENGNDYPLADSDKVILRLALSAAEPESVLEIQGDVLFHNDNKVEFSFLPEHTENLPAGDYDLTIIVYSPEGYPWPAVQGKWGLVAFDREVSE
jgi:hypothetical protein